MKRSFIVNILIFSFLLGFSQEKVIFLSQQSKSLALKNVDTVELPFFDDFSSGVLDLSLWEPSNVVISNSALLPPSIGAVMFDALDNNGNFYADTYSKPTPSDTLTSKPINLFYPNNSTIYLSFFYQPAGQLDFPESTDSLILQFYSPSENKWFTVWFATGVDSIIDVPDFKVVIIPITDNKFLQKGFRFRFINYTSLPSSTYATLASNCDQWFIDYIYLDKNRYPGDTLFEDIAFQYPALIKFQDYTSVPFSHYSNDLQHKLLINFRNNGSLNRTIDSLYIIFSAENQKDTLFLGSYSFPPYGNYFIKSDNLNYFPPLTQKSKFDLTLKLITDQYDYSKNNTVGSQLFITDYYAYDDGSAEAGYGLYGDGTFEALVAAKFVTFKPDTIKAVAIYFNHTFRNIRPRYFYLMIWENDSLTGTPGNLIYEKLGMEVDFNKLGQYQIYLLDSPVVVKDTFYVGWKKTDEQFMNVGLDLSNPAPNYKYYNINGLWHKSSIPGNLMIRVYFDYPQSTTTISNNIPNFKVFPNPTHSTLYIQTNHKAELFLYTLNGRLLLRKKLTANTTELNLTNLPAGVYVLKVIAEGKVISRKIVKF